MEEKIEENVTKSNETNDVAPKFEEVKMEYQEVERQKKQVRTDSYFDGGLLELIGWRILATLITVVTLGIASPWAKCMLYSYQFKHTVYNGKRLKFEGTGGDLFVNRFKWLFFTIITLGIYAFLVPVRKTRWVISNLHFEDEDFVRNESFFDGKTIQLIGVNLLCTFLNFISLGLLCPFTVCFKMRWINKHTVINRKRLVFNGSSIGLFGKYILWTFLTIITFGIYGLWLPIKMLKWQTKNTHIKVVGEVEQKDKSLYIAIPIAVIGVILFSLIIPNIIKNISDIDSNNPLQSLFEDFGTGRKNNDKGAALESVGKNELPSKNTNTSSTVNKKPNTSSTTNSKGTINNKVTTSTTNNTSSGETASHTKVLQKDFTYFAGTYTEIFSSSMTLTIDKTGKINMSGESSIEGKIPTSVVKQSDGSYRCTFASNCEYVLYPAGVSSGNGNSKKARIIVREYGGAFCFQKN